MPRCTLLTIVLVVVVAVPAAAQDGFSMSKLNPFKKKPTTRVSSQFGDEPSGNSSGFKGLPKLNMPKLSMPKMSMPKMPLPKMNLPKLGGKPSSSNRSSSNKPSPITKLNQGTKAFFSKSKDVLAAPWKKSDDGVQVTSYRKPAKKKKKSIFSIFESKPEPKQPESVQDFIQRPRVN